MAEGGSTSNTRQHGLSDKDILGIARSIASDDKITELGLELDMSSSDVKRFLKTNRMDGEVTSQGTYNMIQRWKETIRVEDQRSTLRKALMEIKLIAIADLYIPDVLIPMTARQVRQTREDLINHYKEHDFKIKTSPLDPDAYIDLDKMYTCTSFKLVLDNNNRRKTKTKMTKEQNQIPIEYEGIINYKVKGKKVLRMVCVGEAGVGKSTLLAKMAHDWATAKCFTDITLLFLVHLRKTEGVRSLGEIVKAYLSAANEVTPMQLDDYANNNPGKVLLLLDGLDEFRGDPKAGDDEGIVMDILRLSKMASVQVIVTTRPSKLDLISKDSQLSKVYSVVKVEGFRPEHVKEYIKKFFKSDRMAGRDLVRFVEDESTLVAENLAPSPFFCALLCHLWKHEEKRETVAKLHTFSQLFYALVVHLKKHFLSKSSADQDGLDLSLSKIDECFEIIGKMALEGLLKRRLVFPKDDFWECEEALNVALEVGVLTVTRRVVPWEVEVRTGKRYIEEVCYPHKLLQEFLGSIFLASVHRKDPDKFIRLLKQKVLKDYLEFRYVLYFLAAYDLELGKRTMRALQSRTFPRDFVVDVAFECHQKEAISPVMSDLLTRDPGVVLTPNMHNHTLSAYFFILDTFPKVERFSFWRTNLGRTLSKAAAKCVFSAENIRVLSIAEATFHEDFYFSMVKKSASSKIEHVTQRDCVISETGLAQENYAKALCAMPELRELEMENVSFNKTDFFYWQFVKSSANSHLKTISIRRMYVNSRALDAFVTAPSIRELSLHKIRVDGSDQVDVLMKQPTAQVCHVTKLTIDDESLLALNRLNFAAKTPLINDVTLECYRDELTGDVIASLKFPLLQKLALMTSSPNGTDLRESDPLARALAASWPVLTRLEIARIFMDDAQIETILGKVRRHRYLKSIRLDRCYEGCDDGDVIDTLLDEIKEEGQIDIEIIKASDEDLMVSDSDDEYERGHVESFDSVLYGEFDGGDEFHDNDDEGDNYDDLSDESVDSDDDDSSDDE